VSAWMYERLNYVAFPLPQYLLALTGFLFI
jgi:hypothetical protein